MSQQIVEQGIRAIQQGNVVEGARLLKIALRSVDVQGNWRAMALVWLAEVTPDKQERMSYYNQALAAEPNNQYALAGKSKLLMEDFPSNTPPAPAPTPPAPRTPPPQTPPPGRSAPPPFPADTAGELTRIGPAVTSDSSQNTPYVGPFVNTVIPTGTPPAGFTPTNMLYRTVGISGGANSPGTGFFITQDGLVATTRFVVGGEESVIVNLEPGRDVPGQVVRTFSNLDLALIHTGMMLNQLLPTDQSGLVPENAVLMAVAHNGQVMSGYRRLTESLIKQEWFPTTISQVADSGGNPVFNDRSLLIGMLTHNANRTSPFVYALTMSAIYRAVGQYLQENSMAQRHLYCPNCGARSRAGGAGAFYCETCGGLLPHARRMARYQLPQFAGFYDQNSHTACPNCGTRVGFYRDVCLRCGYDLQGNRR
ncbi:MAG: hypothetical protein OHK0046_48710 [Anaerolineae bacterium]